MESTERVHSYKTTLLHVTIVCGVIFEVIFLGSLLGYFRGACGLYSSEHIFTWNVEPVKQARAELGRGER